MEKNSKFFMFFFVLFGLFSFVFNIRIMDCTENEKDDVYAGAVWKNFPLRPLEEFTMCVRFQFFKLTLGSIILVVNNTGTRPLLQIEIYVDKLRVAISQEYKHILIEEWFRPEEWYHVCMVHMPLSSPTYHFFLDGKIIAEGERKLKFDKPLVGNTVSVGFVDPNIHSNVKFFGNISQFDIWRSALTTHQIRRMANCEEYQTGNWISWDNGDWIFQNVINYEVELTYFCNKGEDNYFQTLRPMNYEEAAYLCEGLGGSLFVPRSLNETHHYFEISREARLSQGCSLFWIGIWDPNEGIWEYHINGSIAENITWAPDEPNGLHFENCGGLDYEGIVDVSCEKKRCPICELARKQHWKFIGACATMTHNINFMWENNGEGFNFRGYGSYKIKMMNDQWVWVDDEASPPLIATLEPTRYNYPHGRQKWKLHKPICNQREGTRTLLLTSCENNEFTCDDGTCIPHSKRCDLKYDCRDNTDESDCVLVRLPFDYKEKVVPRGKKNTESPVDVVINVELDSVMVDTNKMLLDVSFNLSMVWLEKRVVYLNLKHDLNLNFVEATDARLWSPSVYFVNALTHTTTVNDRLASTFVIRRKMIEQCRYDDNTPEINEMFSGEDNPVESNRKYQASFTCDFDLTGYPFDFQTCYMKFLMKSGTTNIIRFGNKSTVQYSAKSTLLEYEVGPLSLERYTEGGYDGMKIILPLSRRHGYAFINIYFPSLTMLTIGFLTLFFKREIFEVRIMTSLTTLLVMATLFTQVAASLPKTSYFKMVDIWLLFCIFSTFFVIVFHILIDCCVPSRLEQEINHRSFFVRPYHPKSGSPHRHIGPKSNVVSVPNKHAPAHSEYHPKILLMNIFRNFNNPWLMEKIGQCFMAIGFIIFNTVYWVAIYSSK